MNTGFCGPQHHLLFAACHPHSRHGNTPGRDIDQKVPLAPSFVRPALDDMGHSGVSFSSFKNLVGLANASSASPSALLTFHHNPQMCCYSVFIFLLFFFFFFFFYQLVPGLLLPTFGRQGCQDRDHPSEILPALTSVANKRRGLGISAHP